MSDNQRRAVCRLAFLLLCALPTMLVMYYIFHPQTSEQWQQRIQSQLAVRTEIDSIETPGPYETVLRGLTFFGEDREQLLAATEVRILFGDRNRIEIHHPVRLTSDGLQRLIENVNKQLVRSHSIAKPWSIYLAKATIESNSVSDDQFGTLVPHELLLQDALIDVETTAKGTTAQMAFAIAGRQSPSAGQPNKKIICSLWRPRQANARTLAKLHTANEALPCWLVDNWVPQLMASFGSEARFEGQLDLDPEDPTRQTQIAGKLHQVDLARYPQPRHRPAAKWASIVIEHCQFINGEVKPIAWLEIPGKPVTRMDSPIEVVERFDLKGSMQNAINDSQRESISRLP